MAFDVGAVVAHLTLDKRQWEQSIAAVKGDQKSLTGFILNNEQQIQKFGKSLTIVGAAITGAFGLLIKGAADAGDYINDLSIRTGIGAETLSAYKLAADKSGTSLDGLAIGMRGLANQMQAANDGGKESQRIFDSLGITYVDNAGKLRPLDEVMLDVADRFAGMADGATKTALAQDIFGRSGMELIPMLNMGRKGLEENAEAARRLGIVWSQEAARKADEFNDSMAELKAGLAGTGREIATALMPTVKDLIENVRDIAVKVREWVAEHPTLTSWIAKLTLGMGALAGLVGPMVMILPKLAQGWHLVAVGLERANLAKTAMGALWTVALGLTVKYVTAQMDLAKAEDYAAEAGDRLNETQDKLVDRLSEAAVAAGWQFGRMSKLIEAYDGNIGALAMAIQKGKEGKDIQEALAQVSEKDAEAYDKWKKSTEGVIGAQKTLGDTLKEYGILLIGEKSTKVTELLVLEGQLTELYKRGKIDSMEYGKGIQKVHEELKQLGSTTQTHVLPPVREFQDLLKKAPGQFSDVTFKAFDFEDALKGVADQAMVSENTVLAFLYNVRAQFLRTMGIIVPEWEGFSGAAKAACEKTKGFMEEVSTVVSDGIRNIARSFVDAFGIGRLFSFKAEEFDDVRFQSAMSNIKTEYDARKKAIEETTADEAAKAKALNALDEWRESELERIRNDENVARDKFAADEEKRQNSLWTKVKGIVATAADELLTIMLTRFLNKFVDKLIPSLTETMGGAAKSVSEAVGGITEGAASAMTGLWTGLGAAVGTFLGSVLKGGPSGHQQQQEINDTKDSRNFLADIRNWMFSAGSGFGGAVWDYSQKFTNEKFDETKGFIATAGDNVSRRLDEANGWLKGIYDSFDKIKSAASGAVSTKTELIAVHGTPSNPEYIIPTDKLGAIAAAAPASGEGKSVVVNFTQEIHFDGQFISDKDFTRGRIIPELREAFRSGAWKAEIQQVLGVA